MASLRRLVVTCTYFVNQQFSFPGSGRNRWRNCNASLIRRPKATLSYYHAADDCPPLRRETIRDVLNETTERCPDKEFVVFSADQVRRTFRQFKDEVDRLALGLVHLGVRHGDRVGIWGPNTLEWLHTQYAAASIGAILVNINPACRPAELEHALTKAGVKTLVSASWFKTQDYYDMIAGLCPKISTAAPKRLQSDRLPELESIIMYGGERQPGTYVMDDVMSMGSEEDRKVLNACGTSVHFEDPSNIIFTSGTTGFPKGVTLTHHGVVNNVRHLGLMLGFDRVNHTCCGPVPFTHVFGTNLTSLSHVIFGHKMVIPSPSFEPEATIRAIQNERCTFVYGTPTMFLSLLHDESINQYDVSSVRSIMIGASPIPRETLMLAKNIMGLDEIVSAYGLTETSPAVCVNQPDDPEEKRINTCGKILSHLEAKIVDPVTQDMVPVGSPGELCVRGYAVMRGYWGQPEKTREVVDDNGWFHTGDIGTLDEDGYCRIVSRIKDVVIRGGANIYPAEVENLIHTHPEVQDVQVIGVPDAKMGEEVCAVIIPKPGMETTEEDIRSFCQGKISHYKIPRYVRFVETFPLTLSGKIQKFKLREELGDLAGQ